MSDRGRATPNGSNPRRSTPRRVPGGIKPRFDAASRESRWYARDWEAVASKLFSADAWDAGAKHAEAGQTVSIGVKDGALDAKVQGTRRAPHEVRIAWRAFSDEEVERLLEGLTEQAIHATRLAEGEVSDAAEEFFRGLDLALVPRDEAEIEVEVDEEPPNGATAEYAAAAARLLPDLLIDDPRHALRLRGVEPEELLERVRQRRLAQTHGVVSAHADPFIPATRRESPPLEACVDHFWLPPREPEDVPTEPLTYPHHALLRRLGPSPLAGRFPIVGLLASIYDDVAKDAKRSREGDSEPTPTP